jgi:hypothetical protein
MKEGEEGFRMIYRGVGGCMYVCDLKLHSNHIYTYIKTPTCGGVCVCVCVRICVCKLAASSGAASCRVERARPARAAFRAEGEGVCVCVWVWVSVSVVEGVVVVVVEEGGWGRVGKGYGLVMTVGVGGCVWVCRNVSV